MFQKELHLDAATAELLQLLADEEEMSIHSMLSAMIWQERVDIDITYPGSNLIRPEYEEYVYPEDDTTIPVKLEIGRLSEEYLRFIAGFYDITPEAVVALLAGKLDFGKHVTGNRRIPCNLETCFERK